jgi:hypothetical protein
MGNVMNVCVLGGGGVKDDLIFFYDYCSSCLCIKNLPYFATFGTNMLLDDLIAMISTLKVENVWVKD